MGRAKDRPARKLYHVGTRDTCARQNVVFKGVCFPRYTEKRISRDDDSIMLRRSGAYVRLTDAEHKEIVEEIARHAHRVEKRRDGGIIGGGFYPVGAPYYRERDDDEPAELHVYIVEATEEQERTSWGAPQPPLEEPEDAPGGREPDVLAKTASVARAEAAAGRRGR